MVFSSIQIGERKGESCSVPVFRYALERWKPDTYKGIYIHSGSLSDRDRALLQQLDREVTESDTPLNLRIRDVDASIFSTDRLKDLLKGPIPAKLPVLAIWYPEQMGKAAPLWMIEPTPANIKALIASPKRSELVEMLLGGQSVIWVFVPSGHSDKDARAKALIRRELDRGLDSLAKLNFFTTAGAREKKLTYGFPVLTLSRSDPDERFFLDMLLKSESDLHEYPDEPMVFPVFGRGRSLGCLFGEYISESKVQDAIAFLAASCSCEVKALNPGIDLLIPAQWDRVLLGELYADDDDALPELTGVMPGGHAPVHTEVAARPNEPKNKKGILAVSGIALSAALVVVLFTGLVLNYRRKKS